MPKCEKKFGWSELIATIALLLSFLAFRQSCSVRNETKFLNKLNFRPTISLRAYFNESLGKTPHFTITNVGPVDATELQVQVTVLKYVQKLQKIMMTSPISNPDWFIERLPPLKPKTIEINKFDRSQFKSLLPAFKESLTNRVLEVQVTYHRDVDRKKYTEFSYYYKTLGGQWVDENDSALEPLIFNPIKNAVQQRRMVDSFENTDASHD